MKKVILSSVLITGLLAAINTITAKVFDAIIFGKSFPGGDYTMRCGFGVKLERIMAVTANDEYIAQTRVGFDPLSLLVGFALVFLICFIIYQIMCRTT